MFQMCAHLCHSNRVTEKYTSVRYPLCYPPLSGDFSRWTVVNMQLRLSVQGGLDRGFWRWQVQLAQSIHEERVHA